MISELTFEAGTSTYETHLFVPTSVADEDETPVVLVFHGGGGNGPWQAEIDGFAALAETEGFIVVHPTASQDWPLWALDESDRPGRSDVDFANQLIDALLADWRADPARIYATGWSIGGSFCGRLATEIPERIAAIASAGQISVASQLGDPRLPMPVLQVNGTDDPVVPFAANGTSIAAGAPETWNWILDVSIADEFDAAARRRGFTVDPEVFHVGDDVIGYRYTGLDGDVEMVRYEIVGGGHVWPGAQPSRPEFGTGTATIDGASLFWEFLRPYRRQV